MKIDNGIIQRYLNAEHGERGEWHTPEPGEYHASQTGKCVRNWYYTRKEDITPDASAYKHFELGNVLEEVLMGALRQEFGDRYVKTDIPVTVQGDGWQLVGETDPVVVDDNFDIRHLTECKTTGNLKYTRDSPKFNHLCQVHVYMAALDLNRCKIVYIQKYDLDTQVHDVKFDPQIYNGIIDRVSELHEALGTDEPPEAQEEEAQDYFCNLDERCCKNI